MIHELLFNLLILLLPVQLGLHFWPEWATVLGRRIDYLSPTLYLTDLLILLLFITWNKFSHSWKIIIPICFFAFINSYFSLRWQITMYSWIKVLEYGFLVLYIRQAKPNGYRISWLLSLAVLYSSLIAIAQFFLQHSIGGPLWFLGERTFSSSTAGIAQMSLGKFGLWMRAYGTFPHPNVLGGFLAVTIPFVIASIAKQSPERLPRPLRVLAMTSISLGIIALILTFSRSAWIVFLLGILVLGKKKIVLYTGILAAGLYILSTFSVFDESVVVRQQLLYSALEILKQHAWLGVGLGNFLVALPSSLPSKFIYFLQPVHTIYILLLSEVGVIGVIGIASLTWILRKKITIHWPIIAILLVGLVDHYPLTVQQGQLLFALFIGLLFV